MKLGAVVVNYRTPAETLAAVRSLAASRRAPDDVVVVDNGSGEAAFARLDPGGVAHLIETEANVGFPAGANLGIRASLARGADAVLLLNSDATAAPDCLERLEAALAGAPHAGIAGAVVRSHAARGTVVSAGIRYSRRTGRMREDHAPPATSAPRVVDAVSGCAMLVRRATFERVGLFAEEYFFSFEDLDFCLRARAAGFESLLVPDAVVVHEGSRSIGRRSPERLYFAARNHLLLAETAGPPGLLARRFRGAVVVALNLAHALFTAEAPRAAGVASVVRGVSDHVRGRYGRPSAA